MIIGHQAQFDRNFVPMRPNSEKVFVKTDTLYFVQEGQIIFEKNYQELGIDAERLNANSEAILEYLRPILETLIRENVQPQESDMEEENDPNGE